MSWFVACAYRLASIDAREAKSHRLEKKRFDAPVTEWPRFDPKKMKPPRSGGKRKAKDAPTPVPLSRFFGAAPPKAKLVLAGSGSRADPLDLSNSPSPPKRSRVEALDELE